MSGNDKTVARPTLLASHPGDWPYSGFHNFVRRGIYPSDWTGITKAVKGDVYGE
jgi:hypothetical protein